MFADLRNKTFTDISNNNRFTVKDQFENIAILDSDQRIDVKRLLDRSYYEEYIDPQNFFGDSNYQMFAEKIRSIPNEALENMKEDESLILQYDEDDEMRALEEKARKMQGSAPELKNQIDKFREILGDDEELPPVPQVNISEPAVEVHQVEPTVREERQKSFSASTSPDDPMVTMFKNTKKNTDFKISIEILNKIPRPDFIEMMEENYEVSIIDYLAKEFTKTILSDPSFIENKVREEIRNIVYKKNRSKVEKTKSVAEPKAASTSVELPKSKIIRERVKRNQVDSTTSVDPIKIEKN